MKRLLRSTLQVTGDTPAPRSAGYYGRLLRCCAVAAALSAFCAFQALAQRPQGPVARDSASPSPGQGTAGAVSVDRQAAEQLAQLFGKGWGAKESDFTRFEQGAAAAVRFPPPPAMLETERRRRARQFGFARFLSITYAACYALFFMPVYRFGGCRLTIFERRFRMISIMDGAMAPLSLRRARRAFESRSKEAWHPLADLAPGTSLRLPSPTGGVPAEGRIVERFEFSEPENARHWRIYLLEAAPGESPRCLIVQPKTLGDWKNVVARVGSLHYRFAPEESPIGWPPPGQLTVLGEQGWPTEYVLTQASWARADMDPLRIDLEGARRSIADPPGRQYPPRPAVFWGYTAAPRQKHPPAYLFLDVFLLEDEAILVESNAARVKEMGVSS